MTDSNFKAEIAPFFWVEHKDSYSLCLSDIDTYQADIFAKFEDEGFEGSGYDWASLAQVYIDEQHPEWQDVVNFDPEGSMFTAYSSNEQTLKDFAISFKKACDDKEMMADLLSRAEPD